MDAPVALAIVRRPIDRAILTLTGFQKVDLPVAFARPGDTLEPILRSRLLELRVSAPRLVLVWQAQAEWAGKIRVVTAYSAHGWTGSPREPEINWSTEDDLRKGQRSALYTRLFSRIVGTNVARDSNVRTLEDPFRKPDPARCPKCTGPTKLRNRKPGGPVRYDCGACLSSWELREGRLDRIPSL
jgi:hypothetical protein